MRSMRARPIGGQPGPLALEQCGSISLCSLPYGVTLSISARKRSRRVSFFLAAYSRSETLLCMIVCSLVNVPLLSQVGRDGGRLGGK